MAHIENDGHHSHAYNNDLSNTSTVNHIYLLPDANQVEFNKWMKQIGSLLHLASEHINLKPILDLLILIIEPERVFLIKNQEIEGYDIQSSIEILLVIPASCEVTFEEFEPFLKMASMKNQNIMLSLHKSDYVDEALEKGHQFYSMHCIEDNMVFSNSRKKLLLTAPDILLELKTMANNHFYASMERATGFLRSVEYPMKTKYLKITGIMLHQAAEQIYKSISFSLGGYVQKTHSLVKLAKIAERYAPITKRAFEDKTFLNLLDRAYSMEIDSDFEITEEEISQLYINIKSLQQISILFFEARVKLFDHNNPLQIIS